VRQRALLALSLPLAAAGCLAGHAAGYALVGTSQRDALVHGYLAFAPQFLAVCIATVVLALAFRFSGHVRGRPAAWPFALLPPLAFLAQELIERLVAGLPAHAALEPAVYAGLAVQLPLALLAYVAARALVRVADAAARAFAARPIFSLRPALLLVPAGALQPARAPHALGRRGRAPPRR
jgi:hypothetical protein